MGNGNNRDDDVAHSDNEQNNNNNNNKGTLDHKHERRGFGVLRLWCCRCHEFATLPNVSGAVISVWPGLCGRCRERLLKHTGTWWCGGIS